MLQALFETLIGLNMQALLELVRSKAVSYNFYLNECDMADFGSQTNICGINLGTIKFGSLWVPGSWGY